MASISPRSLLVLFLVFTLAWFAALGGRDLIGPDEGRYAEIAREMVATGDWVTPRLDGLKYFEKPALQYWATAAAFEAFGEGDWQARLWSGATGFLCVLLVFFTGRRLFGAEAGLLAGAVAATNLLLLFIGHINTLDMGLAFTLQLALTGFLMAQQEPARSRGWMLVAWAALALAVLAKGIVALVLTGGTLVLYSLLGRDGSPWMRFHAGLGVPLFLLITAPWFVAVSMANPEFPRFFFIHEHFERFLTKVHGRYQPGWYFVPVFLVGALPWTLPMLQSLKGAWKRGGTQAFQPKRFLLLWVVVVFGFFSLSDSKLPSYILPLFPALALLAGDLLARLSRRALLIHLGIVLAVALASMAIPFVLYDPRDVEAAELARYGRWLGVATGLWSIGALAALALAWRNKLQPALLTLAAASFATGLIAIVGHNEIGRMNSAHDIVERIRPALRPGEPFYSVQMYDQTLPFYLGRTVTVVDYRDELGFGLDQEPGKGISSLEAFRQRWLQDPAAMAVMRAQAYRQLRAAGLPMDIVAEDTRRIIVRKP